MENCEFEGKVSLETLTRLREGFFCNNGLKVAMNAVTRGNLQEIALNRDALNQNNWTFSHEIKEKADITDQKRSGTCWLFAELNWLRIFAMRKSNMDKLEFSQNYLMFYDKLEKTNYYLEKLMKMLDRDINDRYLRFILDRPARDGGEWHMIANLINKYGLVPKEIMPDTYNRENSKFLNEILGYKIREAYSEMQSMAFSNKNANEIRDHKNKVMDDVFRILSVFMGVPPEKFDWSFMDKDKKYHQEHGISPKGFYKKYIGFDLDGFYTLAHCPTAQTPFGRTYTVEFFDNMIGGNQWTWLNSPISELKKIAVKMIKKGDPVLFGCDVVQDSHTKEGLLSTELYDYGPLFQVPFKLDKQKRLELGHARLTHSMVITGVELSNGQPQRWKIENSWGTDVGKKGYFAMTDKWFDEHVLVLIVPKKYLTSGILKKLEQKTVVLPPWHFMA